ncbi:hypothetical protein [Acinetobacter variabilis]|uniref:hypothetical protein n=1 Tax=Acinetobacter variabilis TaxID=70346 RepID=UPI0028A8D6B8|nr:hypothetical protein [Acinetobacter variabilis]
MIIASIILVSICIGHFSPAIIKKAERAVLASSKEIDLTVNQASGVFLSLAVIALPAYLFLRLTNNFLLTLIVYLMGICVYFDIKRKWIPDPALYTLLFTTTLYMSTMHADLRDIACNVASLTLPYIMLNLHAFATRKREVYISSGDFYFAIPVALITGDWISGLFISSSSLLLAFLFMCASRANQLPLLPFIYIPALVILATKSPA